MHVEVRHRVPRIGSDIEYQSVTGRRDPLFRRHRLCGRKHFCDVFGVVDGYLVGVGDMTFRNHQHVRRCGWIEVPEGQRPRRFNNFRRGNLARHNSTERTHWIDVSVHLCVHEPMVTVLAKQTGPRFLSVNKKSPL